jgi:hypothetical protein
MIGEMKIDQQSDVGVDQNGFLLISANEHRFSKEDGRDGEHLCATVVPRQASELADAAECHERK